MNISTCTRIPFRGNKADLNFVRNIRDIDVKKFEELQKTKVELLLKYRDAKKVLESYKANIGELIHNNFNECVIIAKKDIAELEEYLSLLNSKLHDINLEILKEEEKNY